MGMFLRRVAKPQYEVRIDGTLSADYLYVTIGGTKYTSVTTVTLEQGEEVSVYVKGYNGGSAAIYFDGSVVSRGGTYTFKVTADTSITGSYQKSGTSGRSYYIDINTH